MLPDELDIVAHRDSESHDKLCNSVLDDAGYLLVSDVLYEAITWRPYGPESWRWSLRRCYPARA